MAAGGYAAALLLDGNSLLRRENLRAGEDTVRRWFNAAALVRPANEGGLVVVTADDTAATGALLRWDPLDMPPENWHCGRNSSYRPPCGSPQ
ncbi:putative primosomal protein N' [Arthrobacter sp. Hiyo8]|nr:putative primosomal protein N' [Arthrobacter sp. Hiyo8]